MKSALRTSFSPGLLLVLALVFLQARPATAAQPSVANFQEMTIVTTIVSFNIRYASANDGSNSWSYRRDLVFETIANHSPAIFGVQECEWSQAQELSAAFADYRMTGAGRIDGQQVGEMCAIFTEADRYDILDQGVFWLSPTPEVAGSKGWDAALPRIATWVKLRDRTCDPDTLFVFNTHFDHVGQQARYESAAVLRDHMADIARHHAVILMGDFNTPAATTSPPFNLLVGDAGTTASALHDTWSQASRAQRMQGEGTFHGFNGEATRGRIDWILASEALPCVDAGIDRSEQNGRYPSDHYPVWSVFRQVRPRTTP